MLKQLQKLGQSVFALAERPFNAIFGINLNPLYYLGPIAYFLLWVVVVTGLYLYAFFETGVSVAYGSVEALTHDQWFAGGILRSVHRYASDGLIVTMLLHMLRHFVHDRHRGFRWFSWVTGVVLLWMVFASWVNGYMLPWDRLAQFVVTATTEWFDVLPIVGGVMVRNFITNAAVTDRLFSLLAFIHIGLPLGVLALLWIHTQRVPGARTTPPKPLALSILCMLVVLALAKPAVGQGPVDMSTVPVSVEFDWFYLPILMVVEKLGGFEAWMLTIGATLLFYLLPWLPPKTKAAREYWDMAVHPDERIVPGRAGETLLDAGLRAGLAMPFECRNGACGMCKATINHGSVRLGPHLETALSAQERAAGKTLLCCAEPTSDIEITYEPQADAHHIPARVFVARVTRMEPLSSDVMRVCLVLDDGSMLKFHAGQYINIILDSGERRSFSFASAPHTASEEIELQIRLVPGGKFTTAVFSTMKVGDTLRFEGPLGTFTLREDSEKPILFVAGSTGFAPVKSMVESAFHTGIRRKMVLYWGVRRPSDLYLGELPKQWAQDHENFEFVPVVSDPQPDDAWTGRTGLVHEAILADYPDLSKHQVYACGSVGMVQAAQPAFVRHGISSDDCFSDAFYMTPQRPLESQDAAMVKLGGVHHG